VRKVTGFRIGWSMKISPAPKLIEVRFLSNFGLFRQPGRRANLPVNRALAILNQFQSRCTRDKQRSKCERCLFDNPDRIRALARVIFLLALQQALSTAVFAVSSLRLAIGLAAPAAVSEINAPALLPARLHSSAGATLRAT